MIYILVYITLLACTVDVQTQLSQSTEKERSAVEKEMTLQSKVNVLESQLGNLRQEKSQLLASVELAKAKLQTLEEGQYRCIYSV